jgi:uncharacterized protein (TIGR00369 family)
MNTSIELARSVLAAQPFSSLLGADITRFEPGLVTLVVPLRAELLQQNGFVHGGVLAYAADNGITFAGGSVLGPDVLTSGLRVDYVSPVCRDGPTRRVHLHGGVGRAGLRGGPRHGSAGAEPLRCRAGRRSPVPVTVVERHDGVGGESGAPASADCCVRERRARR